MTTEKRGQVVAKSFLFSDQCFEWLDQAVRVAPSSPDQADDYRRFYEAAPLSEDESDSAGESEDSLSDREEGKVAEMPLQPPAAKKPPKQTKPQQSEAQIQKYFDETPTIKFQVPTVQETVDSTGSEQGTHRFVEFPSCICSRAKSHEVSVHNVQGLLKERTPRSNIAPAVIVLFVRSGRFAGAVFATNGTCLGHTTSSRYTVRKGQGKSQSAQDGNRKALSMGAQLRRHGEVQLKNDIAAALEEWKASFESASFILVSVPKTMRNVLFENTSLRRDDPRLCRVPLDLGRPTFDAVCMIHTVLTRVVVRQYTMIVEDNEPTPEATSDKAIKTSVAQEQEARRLHPEIEVLPLSPLHIAAQVGDVEALAVALKQQPGEQDHVGGEFFMTPLHFASEAGHSDAVKLLLETGHADPTKVDSRGRVPYFLAENETVRDTFRAIRAILGEEYCDWNAGAKVDAPLTEEDVERKREKLAEKRRKKKAKQKERKQMEEKKRKEAEEQLKQQKAKEAEEPKARIGAECDFCKKVCMGQKRASMFKRLGYSYCSTDCVQKHKRKLAADAAMARLGG